MKRHSQLFDSVKGFDHKEVDAAKVLKLLSIFFYFFESISCCKGAIEFDKAVSLKTTEFDSIEEFYEARSSGNIVHKITIPVLFVNAADDPFMDIKV